MNLKRDDWVRTDCDEVGRVVHITGLKVFVALPRHPINRIEAYHEDHLTKVAGPNRQWVGAFHKISVSSTLLCGAPCSEIV
jgi:hypothetical protein